MTEQRAIFIVGGPSSGKDVIIRDIIASEGIVELPLDKVVKSIKERKDIDSINGQSLIVNGNADKFTDIMLVKQVLEHMEYQTAMVYVYTTDEKSKLRNEQRRQTGAKTLSEANRAEKWQRATQAMLQFKEAFTDFWVFDNSHDLAITEDWLQELKEGLKGFFNHDLNILFEQTFNEWNDAEPNMSKGMLDVQLAKKGKAGKRDGDKFGKNVARTYGVVQSSDNRAPENKVVAEGRGDGDDTKPRSPGVTGDVVKVPETQAKGFKKPRGTFKKGLRPQSNYFDQRIGIVPSGGIGLTAYTTEGKSFDNMRKKK